MRIHHFTATLSPRDAVGAHTLAVDSILRDMGHETRLFAENVDPRLRDRASSHHDHDAAPTPDLLLYQMSTGSPVGEYLLGRTEPLVLNYHNLSPAELFDPWEPHIGAELDAGRRQLARLARRAAAGLAVSRFNAQELDALGLHDLRVAPVLFEPPTPPARRRSESPTLLFVGRLAPHKGQHDLIAATAELRQRVPDAHLVLVGTAASHRYEQALRAFADDVCPGGVTFAGSVSMDELVHQYAAADVFVCLSRHEGFCVPVVEAMAAGVPVVAHAAAALPETVADAGLLLDDTAPASVAGAVERVLADERLQAAMADAGRGRADDFSPERAREANRAALMEILAAVA